MKSDLGETFEIKIQEYETRLNNTAHEMEKVELELDIIREQLALLIELKNLYKAEKQEQEG